jgi:salicylate hydroxylase
MHSTADYPILVAGAGIGGLSAAIALGRRSQPVHVLEAEAEFGEVGAGLQIGPNGGRILESWGLGEAMKAISVRPQALVIRDGLTAKRLAAMPLGDDIKRRHGAPYQVVERRRLHSALLAAARETPGVTITSSFRVANIEAGGAGVRIMSGDGRGLEGRALICADGARSRLRSALFGGAPAPSGKVAWRATVTPSVLPGRPDKDAVALWLAPNTHLVLYLCGADGPLNAVAVVDETAAGPLNGESGVPELLAHFANWPAEVREMLSHFSGWIKWPLWGLPPLAHWSKGAATLLGDAAHPILPFLASGAVLAIEDAEVLAIEMTRTPADAPAALTRYEERRMPRAGRVVAASARMGEIYHMNGAMRLARNATLAAIPRSLLLRRHDWLYGYRANG